VFLIQNNNSITCILTDSFEEWEILIQKLKERNSQLYGIDEISESGNQEQKYPNEKFDHRLVSEDPDV
jgi:hypothetical protein